MRPPQLPPLAAALAAWLLAGCAGLPADALKLREDSPEHRRLQTRRIDGASEAAALSASLGVLQDLGFTLDGSETKLGVITASRQLTSRRPLNAGEILKDLFWTASFPVVMGAYMAYDAATGVKEPQLVRVSLVTRPADRGAFSVRVTAQRLVYKDEKLTKLVKVEPLDDPAFYKEFFARLSKGVFLEEQNT
jgi:hypothetical protein